MKRQSRRQEVIEADAVAGFRIETELDAPEVGIRFRRRFERRVADEDGNVIGLRGQREAEQHYCKRHEYPGTHVCNLLLPGPNSRWASRCDALMRLRCHVF